MNTNDTDKAFQEASSDLQRLIEASDAGSAKREWLARGMSGMVEYREAMNADDKADYGCHVDLEPHQKPDGCVIDDGLRSQCIYAKSIGSKWQCEYWQKVKPEPIP